MFAEGDRTRRPNASGAPFARLMSLALAAAMVVVVLVAPADAATISAAPQGLALSSAFQSPPALGRASRTNAIGVRAAGEKHGISWAARAARRLAALAVSTTSRRSRVSQAVGQVRPPRDASTCSVFHIPEASLSRAPPGSLPRA